MADRLPNVPGMRLNRVRGTDGSTWFPKKQGFNIVHGIPMEIPPHVDTSSMRSRMAASSSSNSLAVSQFNASFNTSGSEAFGRSLTSSRSIGAFNRATTSRPAKWVEKSGTVLYFDAYFKEAVAESMHANENFRSRKCVIYYYCEDDTIQVNEPKIENSGVPQGNFIKRHQVPKTSSANSFWTLDDIFVGGTVTFYGRTFHVVGCNKSTASYLRKHLDRDDGDRITQAPTDPYSQSRKQFMLRETGADPTVCRNSKRSELKKFMEATLGNTVNTKGLQGFLSHDRQVLRFNCLWDDRGSLCGDLMHFTLHYFLADDTVEVLEMPHANNGRDPFPKLLCRQPLGKTWRTEDANGRSDELAPNSILKWTDIQIGSTIPVYNRQLLVTDADPMTRSFYAQKGAALGPAINNLERNPPPAPVEAPPFNGWGTEKDSLANCKTLVPKAPKTEFDIEGIKLSKEILRFKAKFAVGTGCQDDVGRQFIITYYLCDSTLVVREPPQRNSGIIGGKFLARAKFTNPATGQLVCPADMFIGAKIKLTDFEFLITDVDEHTLAYMENRPHDFPQSSVQAIMNDLKEKLRNQAKTGRLTQLFRKYDSDFSGKITVDEFAKIVRDFDENLPDQAVVTLMREFDVDNSGEICVNEFVKTVESFDKDSGDVDVSNDDASYKKKLNEAGEREKQELREDALLAHFSHSFLEMGPAASTLATLDPNRTNMLSRKVFKESMEYSTEKAPWSYGEAQAEFLCEFFFGDSYECTFADFMTKLANAEARTGTRGHQSVLGESSVWS